MSLVALRVTAGAGKTRMAEDVAANRARGGKRTAITSPTHKIARESVARLRDAGVAVAYRSAPHRVLDRVTEAPVCKRVSEAKAVAEAGLSVARELCHGLGSGVACPYRETCSAVKGLDEDPGALVWIGPHVLLTEAAEFVGKEGLLIVDEPPPAVAVTTVTLDDLAVAHDAADLFQGPDALRRALEIAISAVSEKAVPTADAALRELLSKYTSKDGTPRLSMSVRYAAFRGRDINAAKTITTVVKVLLALCDLRASVEDNRLIAARLAMELLAVLSPAWGEHPVGDVRLIDATLDVEGIEALTQQKLDVRDMRIADGAPIERVWLNCASASRKRWLPHGRVETKNLVGPLRQALEVVCEDPARRSLGIVTFKPIEDALQKAWAGEGPEELVEMLAGWKARGGTLGLLHYGGIRGRNDLEGCDALITLGDPRPDLVAWRARCRVLGLSFEGSYERAARDELAQAVGRLRDPWRRRPGLAVHVGTLAPGGWVEGEVRKMEASGPGRPAAAAPSVRGDVLRAWREALGLSGRAAAKLLGIDDRTLRRIES